MEWGDYGGADFDGVEFEADYAKAEDAADEGAWLDRCRAAAVIAELFDVAIEKT